MSGNRSTARSVRKGSVRSGHSRRSKHSSSSGGRRARGGGGGDGDDSRSDSPEGGDVSSGGSTLVDVDDDIESVNVLAKAVQTAGDGYDGDSLLFQDRVR